MSAVPCGQWNPAAWMLIGDWHPVKAKVLEGEMRHKQEVH